jgi:hypothetical protein
MSEKVFIVTSGEYSAYHIERVCATREEAENYVAKGGKGLLDERSIEEWPVGDAAYWTGQRWVCGWSTRPIDSFYDWDTRQYSARNIPEYRNRLFEQGWEEDPALPDHFVQWSGRWDDYDGVKPPDIEVLGGVETRKFIGPESGVMVFGIDKDRAEKVLRDEVAKLKAQIAGIA